MHKSQACELNQWHERFQSVKDLELNIRIADVRELPASHINRWEILRYRGEKLSITLTSRFIVHEPESQVELRVRALYHYMRGMVTRPLLDCGVSVTVDMSPFPSALADGAELPPRLMSILYGAGIGALRGVIALRTSGTSLSSFPLPLVNISELVSSHMYGTPAPSFCFPLSEMIYN